MTHKRDPRNVVEETKGVFENKEPALIDEAIETAIAVGCDQSLLEQVEKHFDENLAPIYYLFGKLDSDFNQQINKSLDQLDNIIESNFVKVNTMIHRIKNSLDSIDNNISQLQNILNKQTIQLRRIERLLEPKPSTN